MKYDVTFVREFTVSIDAADLEAAQQHARRVVALFDAARLLSVQVAKEKAGVVSPPAKKPRRQNRRRS